MDRISITEFIEEFTFAIRFLKKYFCVMGQVFLQKIYKSLHAWRFCLQNQHKKYGALKNKLRIYEFNGYLHIESKMPAATAEPITPATFGPIACIKR